MEHREIERFPSYIPEGRCPQKSPEAITSGGRSVFGAFAGLIKNLNIIDAERPVSPLVPRFAYASRLREWEAYEVCFDEGFVCGAIYDVGPIVFNVMIFYDRESKKVTAKQIFGHPRKCVGNTLINNVNRLTTGAFTTEINNQFQDGKAFIKADYIPRSRAKTPMSADLELTSCSIPSVTVMPMGENRPVYTHKELFLAEGKIKIGDREFSLNEDSLAIIDDHKGFYPLKMHYDWITAMGVRDGKPLGINLCKNQAIDPELYSENLLWYNGEQYLLPPVGFEHLPDGGWHIFDEHDAVDIIFRIDDSFKLDKKFLLHSMSYTAPYGQISGWARDYSGDKVELDGLLCMGEDISSRNI